MEIDKNSKVVQEKTEPQNTAYAWMERNGLDLDTLCGVIETIIFMSDKPVSLSKIKNFIDPEILDKTLIRSIDRLKEEYQKIHHGIFIREVAEGYQFCTQQNHARFVQKLFKASSLVLSPSALEVLAIITYRQPISRVEIDKIRSVDSSHLVRGLLDKKLIYISGRSEDVGKPALFATTNEFLETFSLKNLSDLPPERELSELAKEDLGDVGDIKEVMKDSEKKSFVYDEIEEIDQLKGQIKNINVNTDFTKDLRREEQKRRIKKTTALKDEDSIDSKQQSRSAFDIMEDHLKKTNEKQSPLPKASSVNLEEIGNQEISDLVKKEQNMEKIQDDIEDKAQSFQMDLRFNKDKQKDSN